MLPLLTRYCSVAFIDGVVAVSRSGGVLRATEGRKRRPEESLSGGEIGMEDAIRDGPCARAAIAPAFT